MRIVIWLVAIAALVMGGAILMVGPGYQLGFWDVRKAFEILNILGGPQNILEPISITPVFIVAVLALVGGIAAFAMRSPGLGVFAIITALTAGGAGYIPIEMRARGQEAPFIHDITTDFEDPPAIVAGATYPRRNPPEYDGPQQVRGTELTVAETQREAYGDIDPMMAPGSVPDTAERVRTVLKRMNIEILDETDGADEWIFEGVHTTLWFGFKDDFVVRLRNEGAMTRVDVRSKSRIGGSDIGMNARRTRDFMARLEKAMPATTAY